jgi:excisionase family DNA binding protein
MAECCLMTWSKEDLEARIERATRRLASSDGWLTPEEAAARARISRSHFLRLCRDRSGPACSGKGRLMRFRTSDVDKWVAGGCK